ncbi:hypothetical protein NL108_016891 [Boleophthalmus pectinirostris]|nr:hypothetical protein NL108_016891 [Boleophthalmus pectinirostris]
MYELLLKKNLCCVCVMCDLSTRTRSHITKHNQSPEAGRAETTGTTDRPSDLQTFRDMDMYKCSAGWCPPGHLQGFNLEKLVVIKVLCLNIKIQSSYFIKHIHKTSDPDQIL